MRTRITTALITAGLLATLTACGSSNDQADPKACKTAMAKQLSEAMAAGDKAKQGERPSACDGVDDKTLQRITGELISDQTDQQVDEALEETTTPVTAECRAWLEAELLDASDTIDAESGQAVCGDLSDAEMDQAIEDITNDLTKP